jgi:DNA-binding transcriptional regulator GbsR (MarR family)
MPDDRRDHFTTPDDVWTIVRTLVEERKKREIDPTLSVLRTLLMQKPSSPEEAKAQARMGEMHQLIELMTGWYDDVQKLETERLIQLLTLGSKVVKAVDFAQNLVPLRRRAAAAPPVSAPDGET